MNLSIRKSPWGLAMTFALLFYALLYYWQGKLDQDRQQLNEDIQKITENSGNVPYGTSSHVNKVLPPVYFSSILYIDDLHWAVWINDKIYRPESPSFLEEYAPITLHEEGLELTHGNDTVFLLPDQTYDPYKRHVLNGDKRPIEIPSG